MYKYKVGDKILIQGNPSCCMSWNNDHGKEAVIVFITGIQYYIRINNTLKTIINDCRGKFHWSIMLDEGYSYIKPAGPCVGKQLLLFEVDNE